MGKTIKFKPNYRVPGTLKGANGIHSRKPRLRKTAYPKNGEVKILRPKDPDWKEKLQKGGK